MLWKIQESYHEVMIAMEMEWIYREKLGITSIQSVRWNEVLERFIQLHQENSFRIVTKTKLTEHDIVSRILRKENYLVAFINKVLVFI